MYNALLLPKKALLRFCLPVASRNRLCLQSQNQGGDSNLGTQHFNAGDLL